MFVIRHDNEHLDNLFEQHINIEMSQLILTLHTLKWKSNTKHFELLII
jgi:hypothetical protein